MFVRRSLWPVRDFEEIELPKEKSHKLVIFHKKRGDAFIQLIAMEVLKFAEVTNFIILANFRGSMLKGLFLRRDEFWLFLQEAAIVLTTVPGAFALACDPFTDRHEILID
jgi:hypothetical protein